MKKTLRKNTPIQRLLACLLALVMIVGYFPTFSIAEAASTAVGKEADPETWNRLNPDHEDYIYKGDTLHAGKVTVDKSVKASNMIHHGDEISLTDEDNFIVTVSQMAQVMALSSQTAVPVDVVFVLDTSGSMNNGGRATSMVTAANTAIGQLMKANADNRVGVVAFSSADGYFNGQWREYGLGTSNGAAANVLTPLGHYTDNTATSDVGDDAATNHLRWVNNQGSVSNNSNNNVYIMGRSNGTTAAGYRRGNHSSGGGTNIQAGIALGAQMLTNVAKTDTYVTDANGNKINRIPFLIVLSDGAPTYGSTSEKWYEPSLTSEHGDGSNYYTGNGFLAALTAAYYKGKITEHYFGTNASDDNRCFIYTIGVAIQNTDLAELTLDPSENYSATANNGHYGRFKTYWNEYVDGEDVGLDVNSGSDEEYTLTEETIEDTKNYVNGLSSTGAKMYDVTAGNRVGGIEYNDGYYGADETSKIAGIFQEIVNEIALKAISSPTKVTGAAEFDGYVTFTDVIGEYMEVKDMKGILTGDTFYQGRYAAQNLGTNGDDDDFDALALEVVATRFKMADTTLTDAAAQAKASELISAATTQNVYDGQKTQAYYDEATGKYSNSLVWYGKSFTSGDNFEHGVQYIAPAVDDSYEYLTDPANASVIAEAKAKNADTVCRSYLFYGTALDEGGNSLNANHRLMYFIVRVERNLTNFQQTVTVSAPASLLAVEKVYITEDATGTTPTYTAQVEDTNPAHVIYEVGLRSDINEYNVAQIMAKDAAYAGETADYESIQNVATNYDGTSYKFYTNDWDRDADYASHERAMSKATFYAATNNPYYTYQEDTYLYVDGSKITAIPSDGAAYYNRVYYTWSGTPTDGKYTAHRNEQKIDVNLSGLSVGTDGAVRADKDGYLYIAAGTYTAAVMSPDGSEEVSKGPNGEYNYTKTSVAVAHPDRTGDADDAHYTVYLGNNGVLTLTPKESKSVSISKPARGEQVAETIPDGDGEVVMVGDTLTYTIEAKNLEDETATVVVTDQVPKGTEYVVGSATASGGVYDPNTETVTWTLTNMAAGETRNVSFQVVVTEDAVSGTDDVETIQNVATVSINNNPAYTTNPVTNPPEGKKMVNASGDAITGNLAVGDTVVFRIRFYNDTDETTTIVIRDTVPAGTTFQATDFNTKNSDGTDIFAQNGNDLTWTIKDVAPGVGSVVSFSVKINAGIGTAEKVENTAAITVNNNPRVTNSVDHPTAKGDLVLSKTVSGTTASRTFTLNLEDPTDLLTGTYNVTRVPAGATPNETITFAAGKATTKLSITGGEKVTIAGLPAGVTLYVTEDAAGGYTPSYQFGTTAVPEAVVTIVEGSTAASVSVTNTYAASPAEVVLNGTKVLDAEDAAVLVGTAFRFTATECNASGTPVAGGKVLNAEAIISGENTSFEFPAIHFTSAVTESEAAYYLIQEVDGSANGITYATNQYIAQITVADDGAGQLVPTVKYKNFESGETFADMSAAPAASFENSYAPLDVSLPLSGTKTLNGRPMSAGEFEFTVTDITDALNPKVVARGYNAAADSGQVANITFGSLHYTAADVENGQPKTFTYKIAEVDEDADQITYSTVVYDLFVTVEDQGGQLTITNVTVNNGATGAPTGVSGLSFTNTFTPKQISLTITADKILDNKSGKNETLDAGDFRFQMVGEDQTVTGRNAAASGEIANNATGTGVVTFNPLYYTAADIGKTYTYTLSEIHPGIAALPNMDYADNTAQIQVTITQNAITHELEATVKDMNGITLTAGAGGAVDSGADFTNTLFPEAINISYTAQKTTKDSSNTTVDVGSFSFQLLDKNMVEVATAVGPANGVVTFPSVRITAPDTYTFYIKETHSGTVHGIAYDPTVYKFETKVIRTSGELSHEWTTYTKGTIDATTGAFVADNGTTAVNITAGTPAFSNTYSAKGSFDGLIAHKELSGRALNVNDFTFKLVREGTGEEISGVIKSIDPITGVGTVEFSTMYFDETDVANNSTANLTYIMSEVIPANDKKLPGVGYDSNTYKVHIKLTNTSGTITAELTGVTKADGSGLTAADGVTVIPFVPGKDTQVTFRNSYTPINGATLQLNMTKVLHGMDLEEKEFDFLMYRYDSTKDAYIDANANGQYDVGEILIDCGTSDEKAAAIQVSSATNDGDGNVVFTREFPANTPTGTYYYFIKEAHGGQTFINYDSELRYFTMTLGDDGSGNLTVSVSGDGITAATDSTTSAGKYNTGFVFNNYYTAAGTSVVPDAGKELVNTKGDEITSVTAGDFEFEVKRIATKTNDAAWVVAGTATVVSEGFNTADGDVVFGAIQYNDDTTGNNTVTVLYEISEKNTGISGVEYSQETHYMLVTVTDSGNGQLTATAPAYYTEDQVVISGTTVTITGTGASAKPVFTNVYRPLPDSVQLVVNKTLNGRDLKFNEFRFEAKEIDTNGNVKAGGLYASGGNDFGDVASSKVTFSDISFDAAATYYFQITERTDLTVPGVSAGTGGLGAGENGFDTKTIYAKVVVASAAKGTLEAQDPVYYATLADMVAGTNPITDPTFTNKYSPAAAKLTLTALKTLDGRDMAGGEFSFTLTGSGYPTQTKPNDANGIVSFDELTFNSVDTYVFEVAEVGTDRADGYGYNYDETVYTVTVEVTDDTNGQLHATATYSASLTTVNHMTFANSYRPDPIEKDLSVQIGATKSVVDGNGNALNELAGFKFHVYDIQNNVVATGTSDANGNINFTDFEFLAPGSYSYWIVEVPASDDVDQTVAGFDANKYNDPSYDTESRVWSVHILVRYNQTNEQVKDKNGNVVAEAGTMYILPEDVRTYLHSAVSSQDENGGAQAQSEDVPAYQNVFNPDPTSVTITAQKTLTGRDLKDHEFEFVLMGKAGTNIEGLIFGRSGNHADGSVKFNLTYTGVDMVETGADGKKYTADTKTFEYTIYEVVPAEAEDDKLNGVEYITKAQDISVTVTNTNGVLGATVVGQGVTFTNAYTAADGEAVITAQKTLTGGELTAGLFKFKLAGDGVAQTVTNAADGTVTFNTLKYTFGDMVDKDGKRVAEKVYKYTISEVNDGWAGMIYDPKTIEVTVTVTDDLNGQLKTDVTYNEVPIFNNVYEGTEALTAVSAKKILEGRTLADQEFEFVLVDSEGNAVTAKNDAQGNISFPIKKSAAGEYTYTLSEKVGTAAGMSYDENSYKVTVKVTADEKGYLSATVKYDTADGEAPVFKNIYKPDGIGFVLEGTKTLTGRTMTAGEFKFQVHDTAGTLVATGTNTADGKITFEPVNLPTAGNYVLTVTEENTKAEYVTYDTSKFEVKVTVTDKDGILVAEAAYPEGGIAFANKYEVPKKEDSPGTGDETNLIILISLMAVSFVGFFCVLIFGKKKKGGKYLKAK